MRSRLMLCFFLGVAVHVLLGSPTVLGSPKPSREVEQLRKELKDRTDELTRAAHEIAQLTARLREKDSLIAHLQSELKKEKREVHQDHNQIHQLEAKLQKEKREVRHEEKKNGQLQSQLQKEKQEESADQKEIAQLRSELDQARRTIQERETEPTRPRTPNKASDLEHLRQTLPDLARGRQPGHAYTFGFQLKQGAGEDRTRALLQDAGRLLQRVPGVRASWVGKRTDREAPAVLPLEYQVGLVAVFDEADGLQKFLNHPEVKQFLQGLRGDWNDPVIYEFPSVR